MLDDLPLLWLFLPDFLPLLCLPLEAEALVLDLEAEDFLELDLPLDLPLDAEALFLDADLPLEAEARLP